MNIDLARTGPLHVVPTETIPERIKSLQAQAKDLASQHVMEFAQQLYALKATAALIESGGDAYAPGYRDIARQTNEHLEGNLQVLNAIAARISSARA